MEGTCNAAYRATEDLGMLSINMLVGTFVQNHGRDDVKNLFARVQARGAFGGNVVIPPGKKKTEKGDSDQAAKDKKAAEEKSAKDKADKEKDAKIKTDKEKTDKEKADKRKQQKKKRKKKPARIRPKTMLRLPGQSQEIRNYFNNLRKGMTRDADGNWRASEKDVLDLMQHPEQVRHLDKEGDPLVKEAFERARQDIYSKHDKTVADWIQKSPEYGKWLKDHPECKDLPVEIVEFGTPGKDSKLGEKLNTDRDYRAVVKIGYDENGRPIYVEVPINKVPWTEKSYETFGELTGRPDNITPEKWAEKHQQLGTDAIHKEASMDFKDQGHLKWNDETKQYDHVLHPSMESNVTNAAKGKAPLQDPQGIGSMYKTKVGDAVKNYGDPEGYSQAKKACEMLDKVRKGYSDDPPPKGSGMGYDVGTQSKKFTDAKDAVIKAAEKPWDKAGIDKANAKLKELGYKDINDFTDALAGQFESLKIAKKRK